jgi:hypothetical protein
VTIPTTTPTTVPTPGEPEDASVAGSWVGSGADGLHRDVTRNFQPFECHREDDLYLDLQQSGRMITGMGRFVSRAGTTCDAERGLERGFAVGGSVNGARVRLTLSTTLGAGGRSTLELTGDVAGARIDGTAVGGWDDAGQMGRSRGTWSVLRRSRAATGRSGR